MDPIQILIGGVGGLLLGLAGAFGYLFVAKRDAKTQSQRMLDDAKREAETQRKEAELELKEMRLTQTQETEKEINKLRTEIRKQETALDKKQAAVKQQADDLRKQEQFVETTQNRLKSKLENANQRERELQEILDKQRQQLHQITGLSKDEAVDRLLKLLEDELAGEMGGRILAHEQKMREVCDSKSREMLLVSMQRFAAAHTAESTTSTIDIPNDEMKGRIIGREGRNIRAFEKETGIDVIIDDTPGVVIVSGFDPVRREVARQALIKLIADGRIHPTRIEEIVNETQAEVQDMIRLKGAEAAQEVDIHGLNDRVIENLGRLYFRTSYSQNVLRHSVEVAFLSGILAEMIGFDGQLARRCGLLHDIGKAVDHEMEGGHPKIGADMLKRYGEGPEVVHAALGHHDEIITEYPYTMLVATADACSASRPGARRESLERYVKRMEELETIAREFAGVTQAFAIQAGREVRVIASAKDTDDKKAAKVCRDIAQAFEQKLTYPGEIKVTVVRESRFVELAK